MHEWTVERSLNGNGWDVIHWEEGCRVTVRARFEGLACIEARAIASELNDAYRAGRADMREEAYKSIIGD